MSSPWSPPSRESAVKLGELRPIREDCLLDAQNGLDHVFGDGSVKPVRVSIDLETLSRLANRHDGETITTDF